jgi:hypothetical protein
MVYRLRYTLGTRRTLDGARDAHGACKVVIAARDGVSVLWAGG